MTGCLTKTVQDSIAGLARRCGVEKVILFGSRAKGTNRGDIDLAIQSGNAAEFSVGLGLQQSREGR